MRPVRCLVTACLVAVACASLLTGCGGTTRSVGSFCSDLRSGETLLNGSAASAGPSLSAQFGTLAQNLGRFTSLLHHLDAEAPAEIATDMHDVRTNWDQQEAEVGQLASNPLGALAQAFVSSLFTSAATTSVDTYAQQHCGAQLFGSAATAATRADGSSDTTTTDAPSACGGTSTDGSTAALVDLDSATAGQLTSALSVVAGAGGSAAQTATTLSAAVSAEVPAPKRALEALARLRWTDHDLVSELTAVDAAASTACGSDLLGSDGIGTVDAAVPAPSGWKPADDSSGRSSWPTAGCSSSNDIGYAPPFRQVWSCDRGVVSVDLATGAPTSVGDLLPDPGSDHLSDQPQLALAGADVAWVDAAVTPANGLTPAQWTSTLHVRGLGGSVVDDTVLQKAQGSVDSDGDAEGVATVADARDGWVLVSGLVHAADSSSELTFVTTGGRVGPSFEAQGDLSDSGHLLVGVGGDAFLDPPRAAIEYFGPDHDTGGSVDYQDDHGCDADLAAHDGERAVHLHPSTKGVTVLPGPTSLFVDADGDEQSPDVDGVTPDGLLLDGDGDSGWTFYSWTGAKLWTLGGASITDVVVSFGHVVATNTSKQSIFLDPRTGKAAPPPPAAVSSVLLADSSAVHLVDPVANVIVYDGAGGQATEIPYSTVCG